MTKRNRIIYWIATSWLALGMFSTGLVQLLQMEDASFTKELGYPPYFLILLGTWKILGVPVLFLPRSPLLKEWAYAGFFFAMSGAIVSHLASGSPATEAAPSLLLLVLTITSWYFRPVEKRLISAAGREAAV